MLGFPRSWPAGRQRGLVFLALAAIVAVAIAAIVVISSSSSSTGPSPPSTPGQPHPVESIFQDDQLLLYSPPATIVKTLRTLRGLGVDRVRVTVLWSAIAPDPTARKPPAHFKAADPGAYSATAWLPYDRLLLLAGRQRISVAFNLSAPGPLWAMGKSPPSPSLANHYRPRPAAFGAFVAAVGRRYTGHFTIPNPIRRGRIRLPRVDYWSIWNEPNQPGWLAPQWRRAGGAAVEDSPGLYRSLLDSAWNALERTGHGPGHDTVLIGELAPEGIEHHRPTSAIPPLPFVTALYCVNDRYKPLRGRAARLRQCPAGGDPHAFVRANPGLFEATGLAHHPYAFFRPPSAIFSDPNFVPLSELGHLESELDRAFAAYDVSRTLPLYLTEYGYETDPPNPFRGVPPQKQAAYIDQAQYMAWLDPRVRTMSQFLLVDSAPNRAFRPGTLNYWSTFQTGLEYLSGKPKPSLAAYRLPVWIPRPRFKAGGAVLVWAMLRPAPNDTLQHAQVQWRAPRSKTYRTLATATTHDQYGVLSANVKPPRTGTIRIAWKSARGRTLYSRAARVVAIR